MMVVKILGPVTTSSLEGERIMVNRGSEMLVMRIYKFLTLLVEACCFFEEISSRHYFVSNL